MGFLSSLFGGSSSKPATSTNVVSQKLPSEISGQVEDIAKEAQRLYEERVAEGYVPYEGATIAPFTQQELDAQAGIQGLIGTSRPLQDESLAITRQAGERFTGDTAQQFMNPYQQAVIDIEKRKAQEDFETRILPQFEKQGVDAGGMSGLGSRAGVQAALLGDAQAQRLGDIQSKGLQQSYTQGRQEFNNQKARERQQASELARLGPAMFASGLTEQGALATIGEDRRDLAQSALDEAYYRFEEERKDPQRALAEYSGQIYANPLTSLPTRTETGTSSPYKPSFGQQLLGIGTALGSAYLGGMGGSRPTLGGKTGGGLSDLIYRQVGGPVEEQEESAMLIGAYPSNESSQAPTENPRTIGGIARVQSREIMENYRENKDTQNAQIKALLGKLGTDGASEVLTKYKESIENVRKLIPTEPTEEQKRNEFLRSLAGVGVKAGLNAATSDKGFLTGALEGAEENIGPVLDKDAERNNPEEIAKRNLARAQTALTLDASELTFALKNQEIIQKRTKALLDAAKVSTADQLKYANFLSKVLANEIKIGEFTETHRAIMDTQPELMVKLLEVQGITPVKARAIVASSGADFSGNPRGAPQDRTNSSKRPNNVDPRASASATAAAIKKTGTNEEPK